MADDGRIVNDPLGNTIHLLQEIIMACEHQDESDNEIYDDAETVIRKPAMLFEVKDEGRSYLFYFRSVGWERTMLIKVHFQNNRLEIAQCIRDPSNDMISVIIKSGRQLL